MCIVIDTCCLASVFDGDNEKHSKFAPVLNWIDKGKGCMIYGGTKYNSELGRATKILNIVTEFSRRRKTIQIPNATVDPIASALKVKFPSPEVDDEHIVALVIASRCCVVCTNDNKAISYLRNKGVFSDYSGVNRPSIFRGHKTHGKLCCDQHIVGVCREQSS